jgi:hypothetical protein
MALHKPGIIQFSGLLRYLPGSGVSPRISFVCPLNTGLLPFFCSENASIQKKQHLSEIYNMEHDRFITAAGYGKMGT